MDDPAADATMDAAAFALIAHDLKNALGTLESELQALADRPDPGRARGAHAHCTELRQRFVQFLTVYGMGAGLHAHCEDESPEELLDTLRRGAASKRRAGFEAPEVVLGDVRGAPPFWYLDRRLVHMALEAALHNALRFGQQRVVLAARQQDGELVLSIEDDGHGLGTTDPSKHSTGLGTALCRAVAQAHRCQGRRGRVELLNRPEGGARFELWLP